MTESNRRFDAVVFDLDGTLVDTAEEFVAIVNAMREQHDLPLLPAEDIRKVVSNGAAAMVSLALGITVDAPEHEGHRQQFLARYNEILGDHAQPYPGMRELVSWLGARDIGWGVATNKYREYAEPLMAKLGFEPSAGSLVTPNDVQFSKPHPESILLSCSNLGAEPARALYIGDHKRDIDAGRDAGCTTIAATYGYLDDDDDPKDWAADYYVDSSEALHDLVKELLQ